MQWLTKWFARESSQEKAAREVVEDAAYFRKMASRLTAKLQNRVQLFDSIDEATLRTVDFGVIIHLAVWSGPAIVSVLILAEILDAPPFEAIPLKVANLDHTHYPSPHFKGVPFGGYGEAFWVKNGSVVAALKQVNEETKQIAMLNCQRLLDLNEGTK